MSDNATSSLSPGAGLRKQPPRSAKARLMAAPDDVDASDTATESTPLLSTEATSQDAPQPQPPGRRSVKRWPSVIALIILLVVFLLVLTLGFFAPSAVEQYAKEALIFEPTNLSIDSFTASGVRARVQGNFVLDASRVSNKAVRDFGKAATWIARRVESGETVVKVHLPQYENAFLGSATVPRLSVDIRDGVMTSLDFLTDVEPGDIGALRGVANDWLEGKMDYLWIKGSADVSLKSGIFYLGMQTISESLVFEGHALPAFPSFNITKLTFHQVQLAPEQKAMGVDVAVTIANDFPFTFEVPPLAFDVLIGNCLPHEPHILVAAATTGTIFIEPQKDVPINVSGLVQQLPNALIEACPGSQSSPLDIFLGTYIHGEETTIFIRGSTSSVDETPQWVADLLSSVTVPLPFPGHTFDNLIKNFSLANVHFSLPDPSAEPNSPEAQPKLSATVKAMVGLPKEMNFDVDVSHVRASAGVFYEGAKVGNLDLRNWQAANSSHVGGNGDQTPTLLVESNVQDVPLEITDDDAFSRVVQALIFGKGPVELGIMADVDVDVQTILGDLIIKDIPAEGQVLVNSLSGHRISSFKPHIGGLELRETTSDTLILEALVNFTNPTDYSGFIPFIDVNVLSNGTVLGHAMADNVTITTGKNNNIPVRVRWDPSTESGQEGLEIGREFLSRYLSGVNTTLNFRTYNGTLPSQPTLGHALSSFEIELPTPRLGSPAGSPGDEGGENQELHFVKEATMHLFSSTATFVLASPLPHSTIYITHLNATAFYKGSPVGKILHDLPIAIPPGESTTPRLPVEWSLGSVGYEAVRKALGGSLKLNATALVAVKLDHWHEKIVYQGHGIGANVRL